MSETLKGEHADRWGLPRKRYPADRVCGTEGCTTVLSMYNPRAHCWVHDVTRQRTLRQRPRY